MPDVEQYFDAIDEARSKRARELSDIKFNFSASVGSDPFSLRSKAVLVLTYANWEGFYNECVEIYLDFLREERVPVADVSWLLLTGALTGDFNALRDRHHSADARREFVERLKARVACGFEDFDRSVVASRSNLDFKRLAANLVLFDFDARRFERSRLRLDRELVGWRHAVAHGNPPDLTTMDVSSHVEFAGNLMLAVSDVFQAAILARA